MELLQASVAGMSVWIFIGFTFCQLRNHLKDQALHSCSELGSCLLPAQIACLVDIVLSHSSISGSGRSLLLFLSRILFFFLLAGFGRRFLAASSSASGVNRDKLRKPALRERPWDPRREEEEEEETNYVKLRVGEKRLPSSSSVFHSPSPSPPLSQYD